MKFSPAIAGIFAVASTTMAKPLISGPDAQEPNTRKAYYKDGDLKLIFKNTLSESVELIMDATTEAGYEFPRGYSFGPGDNNETVLPGQTLVLGAPLGWLGIVAVNDYDKGTKLEGNFLPPGELAWFDVSMVDGYSAPMTCKAINRYDNTVAIRGCNIDLWEIAKKTGNSCPHVDTITTPRGNNVEICYNRGYSGYGEYENASHPFFEKCRGLAYTWDSDDIATFGSYTDAIECCIGIDCPADDRAVHGKAPWHDYAGDKDHTPADSEDNHDQDEESYDVESYDENQDVDDYEEDDHHQHHRHDHEFKEAKEEKKQKEKDEKEEQKQKEKHYKKEQKQKEKDDRKEQKQKEKDQKKAEKEEKKKAKEAAKEREKAEKEAQKEEYRKAKEGEKAEKDAEKEDQRKKKEAEKESKKAAKEADKKAKDLEKQISKEEKAFRKELERKEREAKKEALRRYREDRKNDRQTLKDRLIAEWEQAEFDSRSELEEWRRERREEEERRVREYARTLSWEVADLDDWCHGVGREKLCGSSS